MVGPSGAGKDSLLAAARERLAGDSHFVFPRRVVTRPPGAVGEDYESVSPEQFLAEEKNGAFALAWRAHGFAYGVRKDILDALTEGRSVVANVSRTVAGYARSRFADVRVIEVTAPLSVLAHRLAARGRESETEIKARLLRATAQSLTDPEAMTVMNDGDLHVAVGAFLALLQSGASAPNVTK